MLKNILNLHMSEKCTIFAPRMSCENFRNEKFRNNKMTDYEPVQVWNNRRK